MAMKKEAQRRPMKMHRHQHLSALRTKKFSAHESRTPTPAVKEDCLTAEMSGPKRKNRENDNVAMKKSLSDVMWTLAVGFFV
jgi:hypothetical protein